MIKKISTGVVLSTLLASGAFASFLPKDKIPAVPQIGAYGMDVVAAETANNSNLYKVYGINANTKRVRGMVGYVTKDGKDFIIGRKLSIMNKQGQKAFKISKSDISKIVKNEAFSIGNGKKEFILFTDPECPFCQRFEESLKNLNPDVKLHVLFYPLSFHKDSMKMTSWILSAPKDQREKMLVEIASGSEKWSKYKGKILVNKIKESILYGLELGVSGTPSLFSMSGNSVDIRNFNRNNIQKKPVTKLPKNVVSYIFSKKIPLLLNPESKAKTEAIAFIDITESKTLKLLKSDRFHNLLKNNKVYVVLSPKNNFSFVESLDILVQSKERSKLKTLDRYLRGEKIKKEHLKELDSAAKKGRFNEEIRDLKMMSQADRQFNVQKFPFIINENGKILN